MELTSLKKQRNLSILDGGQGRQGISSKGLLGMFDTSLILGILIITQVYLDNSQVYLGVEGEGIKAHGTDEVDVGSLKKNKSLTREEDF